MNGVITRVLLPRGFGFIRGEDGQDYFLQVDEFKGPWEGATLKPDVRVTFTPSTDGKGGNRLRATRVGIAHTYAKCTRAETSRCGGCHGDDGQDCMYDALGYCLVCEGLEGSLLPSCPGKKLTYEEHQVNYQHYCAGTGPFEGMGR